MKSRVIVNAAGCWAAAIPHSRVRLRLTKGIHLVVDQERFHVPEAIVMTEGKRILFAIPWGSRVILGTTDTDYEGSLEDVRIDAADVSYVLDVVNRAFPAARLQPNDVLSDWAGIRPLIAPRKCRRERLPTPRGTHQIRHARAGLDRRGGRQADDLSPHGRADGGPDRPPLAAFGCPAAARPKSR